MHGLVRSGKYNHISNLTSQISNHICILHLQPMLVYISIAYNKSLFRSTTLMEMIYYCVILFSLCLQYSNTQAQTAAPDRFRFVDIKLHSGSHYYSGERLEEALKNGYGALELRYGWHTKGDNEWE